MVTPVDMLEELAKQCCDSRPHLRILGFLKCVEGKYAILFLTTVLLEILQGGLI